MHLFNVKENELPVADLETLGLAAGGQLLLNVDDLKALLSGRRTSLLQLSNLEAENIKIKALDAKVSLQRNAAGKMDLLIHPIYKKPATPDFLSDSEADQLRKGDIASIQKEIRDNKGGIKKLLFEYDADTREFLIGDTDNILAPDMVNGEFLTTAQKEDYRKGKEVQLADKTIFSYSMKDPHGMRSNRLALIASVLIDGGLSYLLYKGLNALFGTKRNEAEAAKLSPGYHNAVKDMEENRQNAPQQESVFRTRGLYAR